MSGARSQQDFLDLADRVTDPEWMGTIKSPGPGYELIRAQAKMAERISLAVSRADDCLFIQDAPSGAFSQAQIRFRRQSSAAGALTIKTGSIAATPNGRRFILQVDIPLGGTDLVSQFGNAAAEYQGYEWNVLGAQTAQDGTPIPGEISVAVMVLTDPPFADPTLTVENVDPAIGGEPPVLLEHGKDRGLPIKQGELPEPYRERIRSLPLVITVPNILAALQGILAPYGVKPTIVECFEQNTYGALDWPDWQTPLFVPDYDSFPGKPQGKWVDWLYDFGTFFVLLPPIEPLADFGLLLDDPALTVDDLVSPASGGRRCVSAYDLENAMASEQVLLCANGGYDQPLRALVAGLQDLLDQIKEGGIFAVVCINGE